MSEHKNDLTITLSQPIRRGEKTIETLTFNPPSSAALRDLVLQPLIAGEIGEVVDFINKTATPPLTSAELEQIDIADLGLMIEAIQSMMARGDFLAVSQASEQHPSVYDIKLEYPIKQGETSIERITLRKPTIKEIRKLHSINIGRLQVASIHAIVRQCSELTSDEALQQLTLGDLWALALAVSDFFTPSRSLQPSN